MKKIKFGIIGTGMIAGMHAEALSWIPGAELVAVYDCDPGKARNFAEKYHCRSTADLQELLRSEVEAVTIATPSGLHGEVAIPAARAGKHILCEKPLEVTPEKVDAIVSACAEAGVLLSAVFQSRFSSAVQIIQQALEAGRFGALTLVSASIRWYRAPEYYQNAGWRGTWSLDGGGALMNQGIHTVDLLTCFGGPVRRVTGRCANRLHAGIEVEDTAVGVVEFANGALGTVEASTACAPGLPRRVEVSGTRGSAVLEDDRIVRWQFDRESPEDEAIRVRHGAGENLQGGSQNPLAISSEGHRRQLAELVDAIRLGTPLRIPGAAAKDAVKLICAIYESSRTGQPVTFPAE